MHLKCYECSFVSSEKSVIKHHLFDKHGWQINQEGDELEIGAGPRFCN